MREHKSMCDREGHTDRGTEKWEERESDGETNIDGEKGMYIHTYSCLYQQ